MKSKTHSYNSAWLEKIKYCIASFNAFSFTFLRYRITNMPYKIFFNGGSWDGGSGFCCTTSQFRYIPTDRYANSTFRLVLLKSHRNGI